jgi:hypothetical protein
MIAPKTKTARRIALLALGAILASTAIALADTTRPAYVAAVEPICKTNSDANKKILKGAKAKVKQGKLGPAGTQFLKAAAALTKAEGQLAAVPQPSADAAKLTKWLSDISAEAKLLKKIGTTLKAGNKNKAENYVITLTHNANTTNNLVIAFGFNYCRQNPSRYS